MNPATWTTTFTRQPDCVAQIMPVIILTTTDSQLVVDVCDVVSACTGVPAHLIRSKSQRAPYCEARHIVRYILSKHLCLGPTRSGRAWPCDHTTIINSVAMAENLAAYDAKFHDKLTIAIKTFTKLHLQGITSLAIGGNDVDV